MGIRISEMEEATTFGADDYVPIVTNGTNKKALGQKIKDFIAGFFVSKSGDTMTGDLTVEKSNGEFVSKNPNVTINTTANNGVTSSQIEGVIVKDSANNDVTRFLAFQETNGDVIAQIAAFNKKTDGTATNNYINATVKKDGTRTYTVADQAAFRQSIGCEWETITNAISDPNSNVEEVFFKKCNGVVYMGLTTKSKTYNEGDVLFTLTNNAVIPLNNQRLVCWSYAVDKCYTITVRTNGTVDCYGKGSITGRLIFYGFYFAE